MRPPVTVLAAEFEDLVAAGLRHLIGEDESVDLVACDVPLDSLHAAIEEHLPAVLLLNFGSLPSPSAVLSLQRAHPDTRIVVMANHPTSSEANQLLSYGATACVSKETQARDIINAIHLASRGMHVLPRTTGASGRPDLPIPDLLTPREAEVLEQLKRGATNAQIAQTLSVGVETVRTHASNIYRKLGVTSRRELGELPG